MTNLYYARTDGLNPPAGDKPVHGGKGAGLLDMTTAGLKVPEALILTTEAWNHYRATGALNTQVKNAIDLFIEDYDGSMFSVRSGAPISMPGMMDTILNVGATPELDLDKYPGAFRRFTTAWLEIVKGIEKERVKDLMEKVWGRAGGHTGRSLKLLTGIIEASEQVKVPTNPHQQIYQCVEAVFKSWDTPRAKAYREMHGIPDDMGTACVVQRMVMGTAPGLSGSGVMFSRNPATGEDQMKGEIAFMAQGEEVVSGEVTPTSLDELNQTDAPIDHNHLWDLLSDLCTKLEEYYGDVQDIEFTVESGELYVLQTRTAKMGAVARIKTAVELAEQNFPGEPKQQLHYLKQRVDRGTVNRTRVTIVDTDTPVDMTGLAAAPGAISGAIVFRDTPISKVDKNCILVAEDTAPEDFPIMAKCGGILTKTGGFTCHSAVVARGIGVPAVVGADELTFTYHSGDSVRIGGVYLGEGDAITIDGTCGDVYVGTCEVKKMQPPRELYDFLHNTIIKGGTTVPEGIYYYDCGIGQRVVLPLDLNDMEQAGVQIERAKSLQAKGKRVGFAFELEGMGEDMFSPSPKVLFKTLAEAYPDLPAPILYGVPGAIAPDVASIFNVKVNQHQEIQVLDLLDLLGDSVQ